MSFNRFGLTETTNPKLKGIDIKYRYINQDDTLAEITASGYFSSADLSCDFDCELVINATGSDGSSVFSYNPATDAVTAIGNGGLSGESVDSVINEASVLFGNGALAVPAATGLLMRRLAINATDLNVLVISDSTGNATNEWVYILSNWYATEYAEYSVDYRLWDDAAEDYAAALSISTGSGLNTLTIYNFANSGKNIDYGLGSKFNNSVALLPNCDLIIINHGHNMYAASGDDFTDKVRTPRFISGVGQTVQAHPDSGLIMIAQNPRRDDDQQQRITEAVNKASAMLNADLANVYDLFIAKGKDTSLYEDNVHPSELGTDLFVQSLTALHNKNSIPKPAVSPYDLQLRNILTNGNFSEFTGATPDNWTSNGTITKETTTFFGSNGYSVGIEGATSFLQYAVPVTDKPSIIGKWVTLSALMYIEPTAGVRSGRISIATPLDSSTSSTELDAGVSAGGWKWVSVSSKIRDTTGFILVKILGDAGGAVFVDRAVLVQGKLPANAAS